jgi:hypothetical protein
MIYGITFGVFEKWRFILGVYKMIIAVLAVFSKSLDTFSLNPTCFIELW